MQNITLIKPDDIIHNNVVFERQRSPYYHLVSTPPADMFKKESTVPKITILDPAEEPNNNSVNLYPPSEYSKEFYNKSAEETKLNTYVKNDIWAKAGKKAKEVEKRKQQAAQLCSDWGLKEHNEHLNLVRLPCHRHVIFEECIVCEVVKKHCCDLKMYVAFPKSM
ncbi:hypothetical protein O3G_MSEX011375 [Manduca sexta]|uniref:Uncharacterized protein n=2 Tax=Manduca sexta TaxID=7130 RepID=A0A921ZKI8_MANSE|nr:hypothetical protein O3G_MSEX011375 [Manduca sexta]